MTGFEGQFFGLCYLLVVAIILGVLENSIVISNNTKQY